MAQGEPGSFAFRSTVCLSEEMMKAESTLPSCSPAQPELQNRGVAKWGLV